MTIWIVVNKRKVLRKSTSLKKIVSWLEQKTLKETEGWKLLTVVSISDIQ